MPTTLDALISTAKALNDPRQGSGGDRDARRRGSGGLYLRAVPVCVRRALAGQQRGADAQYPGGDQGLADITATCCAAPGRRTSWECSGRRHIRCSSRRTRRCSSMQLISSRYFKDPSQSRVVDQVAVAPLPAGPAGSHSTVISWAPAIAASSRNKEATWLVDPVLHIEGRDTAATKATKLPPARQSVYNSDVFTSSVPADMIATTKATILNAVPNGANPLVIPVPETARRSVRRSPRCCKAGMPPRRPTRCRKRSCRS